MTTFLIHHVEQITEDLLPELDHMGVEGWPEDRPVALICGSYPLPDQPGERVRHTLLTADVAWAEMLSQALGTGEQIPFDPDRCPSGKPGWPSDWYGFTAQGMGLE